MVMSSGEYARGNVEYLPEWGNLKEASDIVSWNSWPNDVRRLLMQFNRSGLGNYRLSFYSTTRVFKCSGCREMCKSGPTVAHVYHKRYRDEASLFCDECLILAARRALARDA